MQFNVLDNPMKHWFDGVGWEMVDCLYEQVLKKIQNVVASSRFFSFSINEITTINNQY